MRDVLDISHRAVAVAVTGVGLTAPIQAFTDGLHHYFHDAETARIAAHLTGRLDLAGRLVRVERNLVGWEERRDRVVRQLHRRQVGGRTVYRFDEEWVFTVVLSPESGRQRSNVPVSRPLATTVAVTADSSTRGGAVSRGRRSPEAGTGAARAKSWKV